MYSSKLRADNTPYYLALPNYFPLPRNDQYFTPKSRHGICPLYTSEIPYFQQLNMSTVYYYPNR